MTQQNPITIPAAQHQDGILARLMPQRLVRPCGCVLYGSAVISPCDSCEAMTASMDAEAARWAQRQPGYQINSD